MGFALQPDIHLCVVDEDVVLLNERADRYFGLSAGHQQSLLRLMTEGRAPADEIEALARIGILRSCPEEPVQIRPVIVPAVERSAIDYGEDQKVSSPLLALEVVARLVWARWIVRHRRFADNLARLASDKTKASARSPQGDLEAWSAAFERVRQKTPFPAQCLPDTLALCDFLLRRGHVADLVIGVRTRPFRAHCWAQLGDFALNESADHARLHTPIRVV